MANSVNNVLSGKPLASGGVLRDASNSATLPTSATGAVAGFTALGYIGDDGLTETVDRSTDKIRAWGGDTIKVVQTDFSVTYGFTFVEAARGDVLRAVHGDDNVTETAADATHGAQTAVKINSNELPKSQWIFEVKDGDKRIRIVVPIGQITTVGEITYSDDSVVAYPVTIECFADADGNQVYKYADNGVTAA